MRRVAAENCGPQSAGKSPLAGESIWEANTTLRELLAAEVFPVWFLGPTGGDFEHWEYPEYRRILLRDALHRTDFVTECSNDRFPGSRLQEPFGVLLLHCTTCNHFAVIDGNHRLTRIAKGQLGPGLDAELHLSVVEGSKWSSLIPDMNKICACFCA
jgi:hypothetical protein